MCDTESYISDVNSTILPLLGGGNSWEGEFQNITDFAEVSIMVNTNKNGILYVWFSIDGVITDKEFARDVTADTPVVFSFQMIAKYLMIAFQGSEDATLFRVQTVYHKRNTGEKTFQIEQQIVPSDDAQLVKSITTGVAPDGEYTNEKIGGSAFKTLVPLDDGITFTSGFLDQRGFSQVQTHILASHTGQINIIFAMDASGNNVVRTISIPYTNAGVYSFFAAPHFSDYVKYDFTNNSGFNQTQFYYETLFWTKPINAQVLGVEDFIATGMTTGLNRSVIVAKDKQDNYTNVRSDWNGNLNVALVTDEWASLAISEVLEEYGDDVTIKPKTLFKFGRNPDIDAGVYETVWLAGGDEIIPTGNLIDSIVSDDIADTVDILIEGHVLVGSDLIFTVQTIALNGTTPVLLATPLVRCTRMYNDNGTDLVGEVTVYESGTGNIHNVIGIGKNQSEKAQTAFSSTDYGFITQIAGGPSSKTAALVEFDLQIRLPNKVWRTRFEFATSGNSLNIPLQPYLIVPKNSDVRLRAKSNTNNTEVFGSFNVIIAKVQ
jgi:hypothetical protein